jgi:hypothetical protein
MRAVSAFIFVVLTAAAASAEPARRCVDHPRLRTTDRWLHATIDAGLRASPTFRALVSRLNQSDLIVYLQGDPRQGVRIEGQLTFLSAAGGSRYAVVRVAFVGDSLRQVALLGHELRHAVEIADAAEIIDQDSLARVYHRIGQQTSNRGGRQTFDTRSAIETGDRVLREMLGRAAVPRELRADAR